MLCVSVSVLFIDTSIKRNIYLVQLGGVPGAYTEGKGVYTGILGANTGVGGWYVNKKE